MKAFAIALVQTVMLNKPLQRPKEQNNAVDSVGIHYLQA